MRDEGEAHGAKLAQAGVSSEVVRCEGLLHGFLAMINCNSIFFFVRINYMSIVEQRCYILHSHFGPNDFFDIYRNEGLKIQTEILGGLVGYFTTEVGQLNGIVSMWRYDSFEERQRRRAVLAQRLEWQGYLDKVRPMIREMSNTLLSPVGL